MTEHADAEKAAEEWARSESYGWNYEDPTLEDMAWQVSRGFLAGAAWAAQHKYVSSNGKTSDSKSENEGSIPSACAITMQPFRAWVAVTPHYAMPYPGSLPLRLHESADAAWAEVRDAISRDGFPDEVRAYREARTKELEKSGWRLVEVEVREVGK